MVPRAGVDSLHWPLVDGNRASQRGSDIFDENGLLRTDDDDPEDDAQDSWTTVAWTDWSSAWSSWKTQEWWQNEYAPPETWHVEDDGDFLPDFLVGFLLLHRSGLDAHERANILAAIRGQFSVSSVSRALREQWADEDLMRRDRRKDQAMFVEEDSGDEADFEATEDTPDPDGEQRLTQPTRKSNRRSTKQWRPFSSTSAR